MIPRYEPGWVGAFTRFQATGALENGTRVVKQNTEGADGNPDGTPGVILGSLPVGDDAELPPHIKAKRPQFVYFVEWASMPRAAVAVTDFKLRPVAQ